MPRLWRSQLVLLSSLVAAVAARQATPPATLTGRQDNATTNATTASAAPMSDHDMVLVPDVAACDCGFVDNADSDQNVWTSYYHADFKGMTSDILASGLRALTYSIARESSDFSRSMQPQQVTPAMDGIELKVSPSVDGKVIPSAAISSVNNDFWFGSYHMRGKVSNQTGTVAAFYSYFNDSQEADIEYVAQDKTQHLRYTTKPQHYDASGRPTNDTYMSQMFRPDIPGASISDDYRTWSFRWTPTVVHFGLELNYTAALIHEVPQVPSYLLVAHWSDGNPLFSGGPPKTDSVFAVSDIWAIYNSSHAPPTMACKTLTIPCRVDVTKNTVQVPADQAGNITALPTVPYNGTLVSVNGQGIDWSRGRKHGFVQEKWKVITVGVCASLLAFLVIACLWNLDGFVTRCRNRIKNKDKDDTASIFGSLGSPGPAGGPVGNGGPSGNTAGSAHTRGRSRSAFKVGIVRRMGATPGDQPGVAMSQQQQQQGQRPLTSPVQQPYYAFTPQTLPPHHLFERQQHPLLAGHGPAALPQSATLFSSLATGRPELVATEQSHLPYQDRTFPRRPSFPASLRPNPPSHGSASMGGAQPSSPHAPRSAHSHRGPEASLLGSVNGSHESGTTLPSSSLPSSLPSSSEGQHLGIQPGYHPTQQQQFRREPSPTFMAI